MNTGRGPASGVAGSWKQDGRGYWFAYSTGGYPVNKWELVNGKWYHFGNDGYVSVGWQYLGDKWYYLDAVKGDMKTGWFFDASTQVWYYLDPTNGDMKTGWILTNGKWYYLNGDTSGASGKPFGAMYVNSKTPDGYVVDANGAWIK